MDEEWMEEDPPVGGKRKLNVDESFWVVFGGLLGFVVLLGLVMATTQGGGLLLVGSLTVLALYGVGLPIYVSGKWALEGTGVRWGIVATVTLTVIGGCLFVWWGLGNMSFM